MKHADELQLLKAKDVQRLLSCSLSTVYALAERGQLRSVRWSAPDNANKFTTRFRLCDVRDFIESHLMDDTSCHIEKRTD